MKNFIIKVSKFARKVTASISPDKKDHNLLGSTINPFIFLGVIIFLGFNILSVLIALVSCFLTHLFIEFVQKWSKSGVFQATDALAGTYSAVTITIPLITFLYLN